MRQQIAGVLIPDSPMAQAARHCAEQAESELLFKHSHRVFLFGMLSGVRQGISVDGELFYVSALFHRIGLTDAYQRSQLRYEIDGANEARAFLQRFGVPAPSVQDVWDAIVLHTSPGIAVYKSGMAALLARGVEADAIGLHLDEFTEAQKQQVVAAYSRGQRFKERIIEDLGAGMLHRPASTFGTINVCYRLTITCCGCIII